MNAKDLAVYDCCKWKEVEDLATSFPDRRISILGLAFFVEAIDLGDLARLVISAYQGDPVWEPTVAILVSS